MTRTPQEPTLRMLTVLAVHTRYAQLSRVSYILSEFVLDCDARLPLVGSRRVSKRV